MSMKWRVRLLQFNIFWTGCWTLFWAKQIFDFEGWFWISFAYFMCLFFIFFFYVNMRVYRIQLRVMRTQENRERTQREIEELEALFYESEG